MSSLQVKFVFLPTCTLCWSAPMSAFGAYDMLHPHPRPGFTPLPAWPFVVGAFVLNLASIGLIAFLARRPQGWISVGLSKAAWLILTILSYAFGLGCGIFIALGK